MSETMTDRIEAVKRNSELYKALLLAKTDLPVIEKRKTARIQTNNGPAYSYSYADLADIDRQATPVLTHHGLLMDFEMHDAADGTPILTGMLIHPESGGFKTSEWKVSGRTPQDQGGSITYGRRYLTGILTGIITDEDTDGRQANPGASAAAPKRQPKPADPATPEQIHQLAALQGAGTDLALVMHETIGRQATKDDITADEARRVIAAAGKYQS
jgi:hypothetical protein